MSKEAMIRAGVALLQARGYECSQVTGDAVVDGPKDEHGRLPENPDTGPGSEPGREIVTVDGRTFSEDFFIDCETAYDVSRKIEAALAKEEV